MLVGKPVEIVSVTRRMRGSSQSFLVRGSDGHCYVAKFQGNPRLASSARNPMRKPRILEK
jgi:hypothetical protein